MVNACLRNLFEENLTSSTLQKLSRSKTGNQLIHNIEEDYTLVDVHIAVHGLGIKNDKELHNLRKNIFAKDKMCVLIEKDMNGSYRLYFMFYRNPKFYLLNNISMPSFLISDIDNEEDEKHQESRKGQTRWRNTLAEYALTLSVDDTSKVVCPFTLVEVSYPAEATLLRASHIKAYAECKNDDGSINNDEAYDIDNGFLVTANVDALFDKYLISVKDDGTVVTSKTISDSLVFDDLGIQRKIKPEYISEKKKKVRAKLQEMQEKQRAEKNQKVAEMVESSLGNLNEEKLDILKKLLADHADEIRLSKPEEEQKEKDGTDSTGRVGTFWEGQDLF